MTEKPEEFKFFTLVSAHIPEDAYPFIEDEADATRVLLADFPHQIQPVAEFGALGPLIVSPKTRFVAFITKTAAGKIVEEQCDWGIVADVHIRDGDTIALITPDGVSYSLPTIHGDLPRVIPPQYFGLDVFPFWKETFRVEDPYFRND